MTGAWLDASLLGSSARRRSSHRCSCSRACSLRPRIDAEWQNHPAHFWLVLAAALVSVTFEAYVLRAMGTAPAMTDDETEHPREDNRNEEVPDSPVPDPTEGETDAGDIPEAD